MQVQTGRLQEQEFDAVRRIHSEQTHEEDGEGTSGAGEARRRRVQQQEDPTALKHEGVGKWLSYICVEWKRK